MGVEDKTSPPTSYLTNAQAARRLPNQPHPATLWRWQMVGVLVGDQRIKLKFATFGRYTYTTAKWLDEFGEAVAAARARLHASGTPDADPATPAPNPRPRKQPTRRCAREAGRTRAARARERLRQQGGL